MTRSTRIKIYIPDRTYGGDGDWDYDESKRKLEREFDRRFRETDIGRGASWPAFVTNLIVDYWPVALFFSGSLIEINFKAWLRLHAMLRPFFKHRPYFDYVGASLLAVGAVAKKLDVPRSSVRLVGYELYTHIEDDFVKLARDKSPLPDIG